MKVIKDYGEPDDVLNMGQYDRIEHPLVSVMTISKLAEETTSAPVLQAQAKAYTIFRKNHDRLKSEPYFESLKELVVRETAHTVTLFSGKILHKCDISISLGGWDEEACGLKAKSPSGTTKLRDIQTDWDARKTAALAASQESAVRSSKSTLDHASGSAENPILTDSS